MNERKPCIFCEIVAERAPAKIVGRYARAIVIEPLYPVTEGHLLVIPTVHVKDATRLPHMTGELFGIAACVGRDRYRSFNLITSVGAPATQSVFHLHVHVVPRRKGDGLLLPWSYEGAVER